MSGLFKNFANIIPAKNLATKNHNYVLRAANYTYSPAGYYFDPTIR